MQTLFTLVVNPLWNLLEPNRFTFWVLFYSFPFVVLGLLRVWEPLRAKLRQWDVARPAGWGALIGGLLALPAAVYRGLLGGMAAGFGTYGALGPIWGAVVGFGYFLAIGTWLGATVASFISAIWRTGR